MKQVTPLLIEDEGDSKQDGGFTLGVWDIVAVLSYFAIVLAIGLSVMNHF